MGRHKPKKEKTWLGKLIDRYMDPEHPSAEKRRIRADYKNSEAYKASKMGIRDILKECAKIFGKHKGIRGK